MKSKRQRANSEHLDALFGTLTQRRGGDAAWLATLRVRASRKAAGWKAEATAYIEGLTASGSVEPGEAAQLHTALARCESCDHLMRDMLFAAAWIALVAFTAVSGLALVRSASTVVCLGALALVAGWLWARSRPSLDPRDNPQQQGWVRPVMIATFTLVAPFLMLWLAGFTSAAAGAYSFASFKADRAAFRDDPGGFALLEKVARNEYGVNVLLGGDPISWVMTNVSLPNASSASMSLEAGYCHLNFDPKNVLGAFSPGGSIDHGLWLRGVMMHEFAHCLDRVRDAPKFGESLVTTYSLPPDEAKGVHDLEGYLHARRRPATVLWGEAVADTFAVGYWRITAPAAAAGLIDSLRRRRAADASTDSTHATMCWIDHAALAPAPTSTATLFEWADRLRASAPCDLSKGNPSSGVDRWYQSLACLLVYVPDDCDPKGGTVAVDRK